MKRMVLLLTALIVFCTNFTFAQEGRPQYKISNERDGVYIGDIIIELFPYVAPLHVVNFDSLVAISFYDSTAWHRVVPDFVIQGGDPNSINGPRNTWGEGDPNQRTVPAEFSRVTHSRGIIGAARDTDINSATSQFYINTANNSGLDGSYTAYGIVVEGMDIVDNIEASSRDVNDNPNEKIEMFITKVGINEVIPGVPILLEPEDGFTAFTKETNLIWTSVEGAVLNFIEIANDSNFTDLVITDSVKMKEENVSVKIKDIELGEKKFYWRIRVNNGAKFGDYSQIRSFTTSISPPVLVAPSDSSTNVVLNPVLRWRHANGANSYRIQLVRNFANFAEARLIIDEPGISDTNWQLENLEPNRVYCWRVLSEATDYDSPYSEVSYFTTGDVSAVNDNESVPTEFSLSQNYPNPFNPSTTIKFSIPLGNQHVVSLRIYTLLGEEITTLVNKALQPGVYEITFDATDLTSGIYYYRLESDNYSSTRKMLVLK